MEPLQDDGGKRLRQPTAYLVDDNGDDDYYSLLIMMRVIIIKKNLKNWGTDVSSEFDIFYRKKNHQRCLESYECL